MLGCCVDTVILSGLIDGERDRRYDNAEGTWCLQALLSSFVKLVYLISKAFSSDNILQFNEHFSTFSQGNFASIVSRSLSFKNNRGQQTSSWVWDIGGEGTGSSAPQLGTLQWANVVVPSSSWGGKGPPSGLGSHSVAWSPGPGSTTPRPWPSG